MNNIYYSPESYGLKVLGTSDIAGEYEFNTLVVFQNDLGELFYAKDSGCSCPCPFEDTQLSDLTKISSSESFREVAFNHKKQTWDDTLCDKLAWDSGSLDLWVKVDKLFKSKLNCSIKNRS